MRVAQTIVFLGHRPDFILPDRKKYVSMDKQYLKSYMDLVIKVSTVHCTCMCITDIFLNNGRKASCDCDRAYGLLHYQGQLLHSQQRSNLYHQRTSSERLN